MIDGQSALAIAACFAIGIIAVGAIDFLVHNRRAREIDEWLDEIDERTRSLQ